MATTITDSDILISKTLPAGVVTTYATTAYYRVVVKYGNNVKFITPIYWTNEAMDETTNTDVIKVLNSTLTTAGYIKVNVTGLDVVDTAYTISLYYSATNSNPFVLIGETRVNKIANVSSITIL